MSQSNNLAQSKSGLVLQQFPYDTFGEAEPYVCEARMYRSLVLTDFYMLRESKFGFARKMLYLCRALGNALRVWAAAQHSSSELGSAFALHHPCTVNHERQQAGCRPLVASESTSRGRNEVELEGVALGPKGRFAMQRTLTRVRPREGVTKWSWRESNPRPNRETIRFLHAYLGLHFRAAARPKPPTATLSSKSSSCHRGLT